MCLCVWFLQMVDRGGELNVNFEGAGGGELNVNFKFPITCRRILSKQLITGTFRKHDGMTVVVERWRWIFYHLAMARLDVKNQQVHLDTAVGTLQSLEPVYAHVASGLAKRDHTCCSVGLHQFNLPFCLAACYEGVGEYDTPPKPFIQSVYAISCKHCAWTSEYTLGCFDVNMTSRNTFYDSFSDSDTESDQTQNNNVRRRSDTEDCTQPGSTDGGRLGTQRSECLSDWSSWYGEISDPF